MSPARLSIPRYLEALNILYLSGFDSDIKLLWIVQPRTKEDVAAFLKTISSYSDGIAFAACDIRDGSTLDLRLLTGIQLSDGIVKAGAGVRWGSVYERLGVDGLAVAGGRSPTNEIGGVALEGGLSFFSGGKGFICDSVINYEVAFASGEIDFGNNVAIVTRHDFRTFQQGQIWGGFLVYFAPTFPSQLEALVHLLHGPVESKRTHLMAAAEQARGVQSQVSYICAYMNITPRDDMATLQAATDIYTEAIGGNSLRLKFSNGAIVSLLLLPYPYLKNSSGGDAAITFMKVTLEKLKQDATLREQLVPSYDAESKKRHQKESKKYGPECLFQKACSGGFKHFPWVANS
ncbi:hypothetical protein GGR52DRAFT_582432 [Hypoxylon sp. FL1284]|nr:hypothetical protein GGR52DRAFT_582432 [Hypoxylon sp. FL1284]